MAMRWVYQVELDIFLGFTGIRQLKQVIMFLDVAGGGRCTELIFVRADVNVT